MSLAICAPQAKLGFRTSSCSRTSSSARLSLSPSASTSVSQTSSIALKLSSFLYRSLSFFNFLNCVLLSLFMQQSFNIRFSLTVVTLVESISSNERPTKCKRWTFTNMENNHRRYRRVWVIELWNQPNRGGANRQKGGKRFGPRRRCIWWILRRLYRMAFGDGKEAYNGNLYTSVEGLEYIEARHKVQNIPESNKNAICF